jgi:hypothetical protein
MTHVLLTGAGFSRNWGGWLASEAFEYLLGCTKLDSDLRTLLWKSKGAGGGFEDALADLQVEYTRAPVPATKKRLDTLQSALAGMFNAMNNAFATTNFELGNDARLSIKNLLVRFDAIFTLNQDLLLEQHYPDISVAHSSGGKWSGSQMPGLKLLHPTPPYNNQILERTAIRTPDSSAFVEKGHFQPYYKLHGSSNWHSGAGERLLIMGGNKVIDINRHPLLALYSKKFAEYLSRPRARLMVIEYSFGDAHINQTIMDAAGKGSLELFIVDPQGVDILDKRLPGPRMWLPGPLMNTLNPRIIGASRRPLNLIFGNDHAEFSKLSRFFER